MFTPLAQNSIVQYKIISVINFGLNIVLNFVTCEQAFICIVAWLPKESFGIKVQIKRSEIDKVTGCVVLIDTLAGAPSFTKGRFRLGLNWSESEFDVHIEQQQRSKKKFGFAFAFAFPHCK